MEIRHFTFKDLYRAAQADLSGSWGKTILTIFTMLFIQGIAGYLAQMYKECGGGLLQLLLIPLNFGVMLYFLRLTRHEAPGTEVLFEPFRNSTCTIFGAGCGRFFSSSSGRCFSWYRESSRRSATP